MTEKNQVLQEAPAALNKPDQPWEVSVEGNSIIAKWKWMDTAFFAPHSVNNEIRQFSFTVTLSDKGTWKERDQSEQKSSGVKLEGGNLSFGSSTNKSFGKTTQKSVQIGIGKNKQTGEVGPVKFSFDTDSVKKPIREYLVARGWKKAGLFG